ncbi:hypothetical protein DVJ78_09510 [Humibacter sp. BT305]|uniref:hypothetical protein n=1 Tax=Cnuibacter physcomitrellae TaxID=1619308 RepID=UPI000E0AF08B|nr:hypothetical protein [Cnuibacter physcomitrellae]AXH35610.1 hypothetical protein DVJ78_09510 [Humibacter sp. BT305]MCS5496504.1 hypothetical protein [Cnuibacter physcomitrellae]
MDISFVSILAAAAGGFFGAALGALQAFIFTGFLVLAGVVALIADPNSTILSDVAFGPAFGPHIAFAGGVAAAAYASRKSELIGKDIVTPLAKFARPDVLLIGAVFGLFGYFVQKLIALIPWFGQNTDSVALTVIISAIVVRLIFGKSGLFPKNDTGASGWAAYSPTDKGRWIEGQERFVPNTVLGIFVGLLSAFVAVTLLQSLPQLAGSAQTFMFGISAVSLMFLSFGHAVPVTHHITLPAGVAAVTFLPIVGEAWIAMLIGALGGLIGAWFAEFFSRLWLAHGDTHIDPPAAAIWPATTLILGAAAIVTAVS